MDKTLGIFATEARACSLWFAMQPLRGNTGLRHWIDGEAPLIAGGADPPFLMGLDAIYHPLQKTKKWTTARKGLR